MKAIEIRDLSSDEIRQKLDESTEELFNLRFQHATDQLENPMRLGQVRKDIARMKTVVKERVLTPGGDT
jgi:large subunit ribosomal protein L29